MKLRDGMKVTCEIDGTKVKDAKIHEVSGRFFICQDARNGSCCSDRLGYKYSWFIADGSPGALLNNHVTNLKPLSSDIENVYEGAIIRNESYERKVFGICGEIVFVSNPDHFDVVASFYTIPELKKYGYSIVLEDPQPTEKMIVIDGKEFSESTIKAALKEYVG